MALRLSWEERGLECETPGGRVAWHRGSRSHGMSHIHDLNIGDKRSWVYGSTGHGGDQGRHVSSRRNAPHGKAAGWMSNAPIGKSRGFKLRNCVMARTVAIILPKRVRGVDWPYVGRLQSKRCPDFLQAKPFREGREDRCRHRRRATENLQSQSASDHVAVLQRMYARSGRKGYYR